MAIPRHTLSKSTFLYGIQCPKRLYFHKFHPEFLPEEIDEQVQARFDEGTDVGILAQRLFPDGIDSKPATPYEYQKSVEKTKNYLLTHSVIYEACFQFEGVLCAVDILIKKGKQWYAYEVKSTNSVKSIHEIDAALQYYVLTQTGLPLADVSIIHFDRDYIRKGELDISKLFHATSVLYSAIEMQDFIAEKSQELKQLIASKQEPQIDIGSQCKTPYPCPFIDHCWKDVEVEVVENLSSEPIINTKDVQNFLSTFEYPFNFFDFETVMYGIPPFSESSPYQQLPFQYSLHVQNDSQSQLEHFEFLGDGIHDPREAMIQQMIQELGTTGSIITWNMTFEKMCIRKLIENFPTYENELQAIHDRIVDLMIPFKKKWIDIPACEGSASIKKVLPVFIPELSYETLDIQEGMYGSFVYSQLKYQDEETQELQRQQLLEYCKLDTLAMVKILEKIMKANSILFALVIIMNFC